MSGLHDFDYPSLLEAGVGLDTLPELTSVKRMPLPPELTEQFDRMQCNCMMGLFPEIERAYLTIDSDIFVWKYEDGSDLAYFDGLNETILSVALIKPKPGIFQPHIQHLLCLATPVDIVLLGVSFSKMYDGPSGEGWGGEMHLLPEPLYSIPTDSTFITAIAGTEQGRIFMAGKDGALYELIYQAEDGWFSRKCRKVCHSTSSLSFLVPSFLNFSFSQDDPLVQISIDSSRHILYGRTQKGSIQVYDLGPDGKGMGRVASVSQQTILNSAALVARTVEKSNFKSIVYISALTSAESANIHLVAITQTGVRLYFTTMPFGTQSTGPSMLTLIHVRLPPGFSAGAITQRPNNVHTAYHKKGTLLLVSSQNEDNDLLWAVSSDTFPFQKQLMETQTTVAVDGKTWALGELHTPESGLRMSLGFPSRAADPPVVVTQHIEQARRFVILTAQGCHILRKLRPVEQLQSLLIDCGGPDAEEVKAFFRLHKLDQACATCLVLACSRSPADQQVADWARMAFFMYGGEAQYNFGAAAVGFQPATIGSTSFSSGPGNLSNTIMYSPGGPSGLAAMTPMPGMMPAHMSTPLSYGGSLHQSAVGPVPGSLQEVIYSGKHNGIYIYLARILRPFWDTSVTAELQVDTSQGPTIYLTSNYSSEELAQALELVRDLSDFVDFNSKFDAGGSSDMLSPTHLPSRLRYRDGALDDHTRKKLQGEAQRVEKISLQHVQELLHRVEEVLGLWRVLLDHQFHMLSSALSQDQQNQLRSLTFKTLVLSGKDVCAALIACLISRYLNDNATVDAISSRLREVCPSLYSTDDATCSKSNELLQITRVTQDPIERRLQLQEALRLLKTVIQPLQLRVVCNQLAAVAHYTGIVDLCLAEARKCDPHDLAQHFYTQGEQPEDTQGMQAYIHRMECYKCITETLGYLWNAAAQHPQSPSMPQLPGPPQTRDPNHMAVEQAQKHSGEVLETALKSNDMLFHSALYSWFFTTNRSEQLLNIQTPYLESYLQRRAGQAGDKIPALDMLWKHYEKKNNFTAAARILAQLSQRHGMDLPLDRRLEYLSRSIMCAKAAPSGGSAASSGEFLHELEEKMEVARLQQQVQKALLRLKESNVATSLQVDIRDALERLQSDLLDITMLYEDFADRFDLWECKLAIVHCAGLFDSALIENLWQNIINKELTLAGGFRGDDQLTRISEHLASIMKHYVTAERYFPLPSIVRQLEQRSCEQGLSRDWVFKTMLKIGITLPRLLELYNTLFKQRDPFWQSKGRPLHLLEVLHVLLSHLADNPALTLIPPMDRRRFSMICLDAVSTYLIELQAMAPHPDVQRLMGSFKSVQARLERM